ncbi:MAG: HoxN/HupN/NixA family nickel/cobalt transporter [Gemmatimonadaceae bacterium]
MLSLLTICALGFFLGMRHATDPDHVVAVSAIVARHRRIRDAAVVGAVWGIGHTLTIVVVGGAIILFGWVIPPRLGLSMEFSVALMLIVLGLMNLSGFVKRIRETAPVAGGPDGQRHVHAHIHGDYVHTHEHNHQPEHHPHDPTQTPLGRLDRKLGALGAYRFLRPLIVGVVHGMAGSAAVALLVMASIGRSSWSVLYLLVFGLGTVIGMMLVTAAIGIPFAAEGTQRIPLRNGLRVASGVLSLAFGLFLAYRVGVLDGLFAANPAWTPR